MKNLHKIYDKMQSKYGDPNLNAIYGGGCTQNAKVCLVFMNPTKRNIASVKSWQGVRYQWLGTKQVWDFLAKLNLISENLNNQIQSKKPKEWSEDFCKQVYNEVERNGVYITNLAKCTQVDARPLPDSVFKEYKDHLLTEISLVNPQKILLFGNQVSSIVLNQKITVSTCRKQKFELPIKNKTYNAYAVYYPVGNGRFNIDKCIEDCKFNLDN